MLMMKHLVNKFSVVALVLSFSLPSWAQETIPFVPSPMIVVDRMLELAEVKKDDIIYDLGSGDGRILIQAAKKYGVRGVGIDMNPKLVEDATRKAAEEKVSHLVQFRAADGLTVDISDATVVTLYMFKWFNNQMRPKLQRLKPGARVVAHDFGIDEWEPNKVENVDPKSDPSGELTHARTLYLWSIGTPAQLP
jgi:cyclopropane fatty-acyl-phospholipid synthase-like methyltransferase